MVSFFIVEFLVEKNPGNMSYTSRVIANLVSYFLTFPSHGNPLQCQPVYND